ncbi:PEP/pyruvate-binding domain-containing protein [Chitiniphilus shinanonensis]|uniref:PEP/pyruvate-binding domain-containing protein n=1 Tax=Chitiniphilus shinanonensis TaxID=553088 RepID=UPI00304E1878
MSPLLSDWPAILAAGAAEAGGKAWTLARLARYGFPVPDGMVLPVAVYRAWLDRSGLARELHAAAALHDAERIAALTALRPRLLARRPDDSVLAALRQRLASPPWRDGALAVRSSAPQEDGADASFAGIHASLLNVRGEAALADAIVTVWASLWTPAAVAYRARLGIAHDDAAMAVLLMPLLPARASGIAFTCDPVSGRDDRLVIHANWGLGESLVAGATTGDEIVLGEQAQDDSLALLACTPGAKALTSVPAPDGGTALRRGGAESGAAVLTPAQSRALGELLRQAALALDYGHPVYDCEWAWDGERFWLLQARPVTARGRCTYPELLGQPDIWTRGNTRDVVPDPLPPMDWGSWRRLANALLETGFRLTGFAMLPGAQRTGLFDGRLYLNLSLIQWEGYAAFNVLPAAMNRLVGGRQPEIRVPPRSGRERLAVGLRMARYLLRAGTLRRQGPPAVAEAMRLSRQWREQPLPADDAGFAAEIRRQARHRHAQAPLHFMQGSGGGYLSLLVDLLDAHRPGEGHALASALLAGGEPSVTLRQGYALSEVARIAMADPTASAWLAARRPGDDWRDLPPDNPFRAAFADFLAQYGHRCVYETYLGNPRWREAPDYLLDSLPGLAAADMAAAAARQRQAADTAWAEARRALPWWKRPLLARMVRTAKHETNDREAARSALMAYTEPARRLWLALGERWTARGWLARADDVWFLMPAEALAVLDGLRPGAALAALIADRRQRFATWQAQAAPDVILQHGGAEDLGATAGVVPLAADGHTFQGVAVGSGVASGPARLIHHPDEGARLAQGDILVVPSTDPAWTLLFLKAGGLVMETGGFLSHGAIVAREFGIPAVVNLPGILQRLRDGERLRVDGARGTVSRLD